jgi:hypothetical protein
MATPASRSLRMSSADSATSRAHRNTVTCLEKWRRYSASPTPALLLASTPTERPEAS